MLWKIVKGVVAAVLITKITERYFKDKNAPVQLDLDIPAKPLRETGPISMANEPIAGKPLDNPSTATESTI